MTTVILHGGPCDGEALDLSGLTEEEAALGVALPDLTELWEASLDARRAMYPRSPVPTLDALVQGRVTPEA